VSDLHGEVKNSSSRQRKSPALENREDRGSLCKGWCPQKGALRESASQSLGLDVDHLAAGVQRALHLDFLALEFLDLALVVDVVGLAAGVLLEHILVP
jgi:hypothetical protein